MPGIELVSRVSLSGGVELDRGGSEWSHHIRFARPVKRWVGTRPLSAARCCRFGKKAEGVGR
jgi:hypothetical protein